MLVLANSIVAYVEWDSGLLHGGWCLGLAHAMPKPYTSCVCVHRSRHAYVTQGIAFKMSLVLVPEALQMNHPDIHVLEAYADNFWHSTFFVAIPSGACGKHLPPWWLCERITGAVRLA